MEEHTDIIFQGDNLSGVCSFQTKFIIKPSLAERYRTLVSLKPRVVVPDFASRTSHSYLWQQRGL